ncbi:DUF1801 domain-containing protein [Brachybacterium aquaticum]|uniref:YdhG-like domain-containing protein n=1 Tax=Brachybacterium aquaticum TaxID=1432564 RepID=A0A841ABJ0_9MICO|nr:DUF1801 domain-containing protein [Brachybacterium aquaticum]MBB5830725.1 hypothetical protein [Brachybacterium aquaticum]
MATKDEKNLAQVIDKIGSMDEPVRSLVQRVHEIIVAAAPDLKPRIWYGMPAYARSASTPALVTLRNDERVNLALTEKVELVPAGGVDGTLMPAAWYLDELDAAAEKRITEIVRAVVG